LDPGKYVCNYSGSSDAMETDVDPRINPPQASPIYDRARKLQYFIVTRTTAWESQRVGVVHQNDKKNYPTEYPFFNWNVGFFFPYPTLTLQEKK